MFFIALTFVAALSLEVIGSYISVLGLAAIFASNPIIMVMAVVLDFAKLVTVSFVYQKWTGLNRIMRTYMLIAAIVLMTITSAGAFGYLSAEFQNAVIPNKESAIKLQTLTDEQTRLQARKVDIDKQISQIPANIVRNRIKLIDSFKSETQRINDRLSVIDQELPKLKIENVTVSAHTGPIAYVATAFNVSMEEAVKYVILLIIFVFDPLAISLILAGNFLLCERAKKKEDEKIVGQAKEPSEIKEAAIPVVEKKPINWDGHVDFSDPQVKETLGLSEVNDSLDTELPITNPWEAVPLSPEEVKDIVDIELEPAPKVRTGKQLDKLAEKFHASAKDEVIPPELLVKEEFTSPVKNDTIINQPLKGIMSAANADLTGADVHFEDSPSKAHKQYL